MSDETAYPRLRLDRDLCIGAGLCVLAAGEVFDQAEDDGLVVLLAPRPADPDGAAGVGLMAGSRGEAIREAVRQCPSGALSWGE